MGKFEFYEAKDGWRWRLLASNGQTIATGGEAYDSKQGCKHGINSVIENATLIGSREARMSARPNELIVEVKGSK